MKKHIKLIVIVFFSCIFLSYLVGYLVQFPSAIPIAGNSDTWIQYWGSFLGAIIGILGAFFVMNFQIKAEKEKIENERVFEVYVNFILKYFHTLLIILRYRFDPYGGDKKYPFDKIDELIEKTMEEMFEDIQYASPNLKKSLIEWRTYQIYVDDLRGGREEEIFIDLLYHFFLLAHSISKEVEDPFLDESINETKYYYIMIMFSKLILLNGDFYNLHSYVSGYSLFYWGNSHSKDFINEEQKNFERILSFDKNKQKEKAEHYSLIIKNENPDYFNE